MSLPEPNNTSNTAEPDEAAEVEASRKSYLRSIADMQITSMEHKANILLSLVTHGAMECMTAASTMLPGTSERALPANARWQSPNARNARRFAELQNLTHLTEAGSRIIDAYTRLRASNYRQILVHNVSRQRHKDGSFEQTTYRHFTPVPGPKASFDPGEKEYEEVLERVFSDAPPPPTAST